MENYVSFETHCFEGWSSLGKAFWEDIARMQELRNALVPRLLPYEAVRENPYHNGEVLFIQGSKDNTLPAQRTLDNMDWYEQSSFVFIDGAPHGFGREANRPALITVEVVTDFIQRTCSK